jgi:hypothetical protein
LGEGVKLQTSKHQNSKKFQTSSSQGIQSNKSMAIGYRDFFPALLKKGVFISTEHEGIAVTVARANEWIALGGIRVINVETVVLPNIKSAEDASQVGIRTSGDLSSYWYQVVRVWYEVPNPPSA